MADKRLVAVFSASGVTEKVGKEIARVAGADFYEIVPKEIYTSADLDWMNKKSRSSIEMNDPSARPEINGKVADMASYDTVIVGFPIWWGVAPRIIDTFLESYEFSGKNIIPFLHVRRKRHRQKRPQHGGSCRYRNLAGGQAL